MRPSNVTLLALPLALLAAACGAPDRQSPVAGAMDKTAGATETVAEPAPVVTPAPATTVAEANAAPKPSVDFTAELRRLDKRCTPKTQGESNMELKVAAAEAADCATREAVRELDKTLLAQRSEEPAKFRHLMKEQAEHNALVKDASFLAEELVWIDFTRGVRHDGTARGFSELSCEAEAGRERFLYARALREGDASSMAKRMKARAKIGKANLASLEHTKRLATERSMKPAPTGDDEGGIPMTPAAFQEVFASATDLSRHAKTLATSACEGFPGLKDELGASCERTAEVYFAGTCAISEPTAPGEG